MQARQWSKAGSSEPWPFVQALLQALVVAVLLGILGMHALNLPGLSPDSGHAEHAHPSEATVVALSLEVLIDAPATDAGRGLVGLATLCCGAMLGAVLGLLWLAVRGRRWTRSGPGALRLLQHMGCEYSTRHGQGPPYIWNFSVTRC